MTSEVRSVTVRLDADVAAYIAKMKAAGKVTNEAFSSSRTNLTGYNRDLGVTEHRLQGITTAGRRASPAVSQLDTGFGRLSTSARRAGPDIDRLSGRVRLLAQLATIGLPALVGIGAVGVPALAGIAAAFGGAALAGGSLLIATQGVGDAVKALEAARLDPTVENIDKAQKALDQLGPHAAEFAVAWQQHALPVFRQIRDQAAAGWFPGLTDQLDELESLGGRVGSLLQNVGEAGAESLASSLDSLDSSRWDEFWTFLDAEAPDIVTRLSTIVGDLTHAGAELWMSFDPGNDDFLDFVAGVTDELDQWASSEEGRESIQAFLDYTREVGPDVLDFFSSTVDMLTEVSQAASPLAGPVLEGLTAVADVIAAIADSDLGTPIIAGLAALSLYNRALQLTTGLQTRMTAGTAGWIGAQVKASTGTRTLISDLGKMRAEYSRLGKVQAVAMSGLSGTSAAAQRVRSSLSGLGRTVGVVGALAVASTGVADSMGLSKTASLGLLGAMVKGGPGAVAGGLIGATLDYVEAGREAAQVQRQLDNAFENSGGTISGYVNELEQGLQMADQFAASVSSPNFFGQLGKSLTPGGIKNNLDVLFGGFESSAIGQMAKDAEIAEEKIGDLQFAGRELAFALGLVGERGDATFDDMDAALASVAPAMQDLGITVADLIQGVRDGSIVQIVEDLTAWQSAADSAAGRTRVVGDAIAGLGNDMISTQASAEALQAALDRLLSPNLNLSEATDAWTTALRTLDDELAKNSRALEGNTQGAITNREAIRERITTLTDMLVKEAEAGAGPRRLATILDNQTQSLLAAGEAAGLSRPKLAAFLREMGLTPKLVRTVFEAAGIGKVEQQARDLRGVYEGMPKKLQAEIRAEGIPTTMGQVNRLVEKYQLTEKQRTALVKVRDLATKDLQAVLRALGLVEKPRQTTVTADTVQAMNKLAGVKALLNSIKSKSVTLTTNVVTNQIANKPKVTGPDAVGADGLTVPGPRYPYGDKTLIYAAPGEEIISNRYGQADQFRADRAAGRIPSYANGGTAGPFPGNVESYIGGTKVSSVFTQFEDTLRFWLREQRRDLESRRRLLDKEVQARQDALRDVRNQRRDLVDALVSRLTQSVWGGEAANIGNLSLDQVLTTAADQAAIPGLIKSLEGRLAAGTLEALREHGSVEQLEALIGATDEQLAQFEKAWTQMEAAADPLAKLEEQISEIHQLDNLERNLRAMGLSGEAFRDLLKTASIEEIQALMQRGREDVLRYQALFEQRQNDAQEFAGQVGDAEFGADIKAARELLQDAKEQRRETNERLERIEDHLQKIKDNAPERTGDAVADALNDTGARASRTNGHRSG